MEMILIVIFVLGYAAIAFEHTINVNKAASALLTGVLCWTVYIFFTADKDLVDEQLSHHLGELSGILFFLMGAMTIVELIDAHDGFQVITSRIVTNNKRKLLWILCILTFFLSAALDNLTTAIVMTSLCGKILADKTDRMFFVGMIVVSANAGGAWSPIGDVTTTMLWIGGQITSLNIISKLLIPSLFCCLIPLTVVSFIIKGKVTRPKEVKPELKTIPSTPFERNFVFFAGVSMLIFVPIFKTVTHLPPYMGILFGLGVLWVLTEIIHFEKEEEQKSEFSVIRALQKIDVPSILFFLGILIAISALESTHILNGLAQTMDEEIGNINLIVLSIGVLSSIVDNVPLVAAAMGMYDLSVYPVDDYFWEFIAYCAGTGGSLLIIGSAAGVAAMGIEKIEFFWYLKKIGWLAFIGYISGALVYIAQHHLLMQF